MCGISVSGGSGALDIWDNAYIKQFAETRDSTRVYALQTGICTTQVDVLVTELPYRASEVQLRWVFVVAKAKVLAAVPIKKAETKTDGRVIYKVRIILPAGACLWAGIDPGIYGDCPAIRLKPGTVVPKCAPLQYRPSNISFSFSTLTCCGDAWKEYAVRKLAQDTLDDPDGCGGKAPFHMYSFIGAIIEIFNKKHVVQKDKYWNIQRMARKHEAEVVRVCPFVMVCVLGIRVENFLVASLPLVTEETPRSVVEHTLLEVDVLIKEFRSMMVLKGLVPRTELQQQLIDRMFERISKMYKYVNASEGKWFGPAPSWRMDEDIAVSLQASTGMKELMLPGSTAGIGDLVERRHQTGVAPYMWEKSYIGIIHVVANFFQLKHWNPKNGIRSWWPIGGTLLGHLRYGNGFGRLSSRNDTKREWAPSGSQRILVDMVDADIDLAVTFPTAEEWWEFVLFLNNHFLSEYQWNGCSLSVVDAYTSQAEEQLSRIRRRLRSKRLDSRGVAELVCQIHFEAAVIPLNIVWMQVWRGNKRVLRGTVKDTDGLVSMSACDNVLCMPMARFPTQAWDGYMPGSLVFPMKSCAFVMRGSPFDFNPHKAYQAMRIPCPNDGIGILRWYDAGEYWGRALDRPCLALPMMVAHDRVNHVWNTEVQRGLTAGEVQSVRDYMLELDNWGFATMLTIFDECKLNADGSYTVPVSTFKGTSVPGDEDFPSWWESCVDGFHDFDDCEAPSDLGWAARCCGELPRVGLWS